MEVPIGSTDLVDVDGRRVHVRSAGDTGPPVLLVPPVLTQTVAPFLPRLRVPAEVVGGRRDHQMRPPYGERLARDIPGARLTWVEDARHVVPADRPGVVAEAVLRLVDRATQ